MPTHRYRKRDALGHGGGGNVYRGRTRFELGEHERDCAVKLVHASQRGDAAVVARFADEAILGYDLANHPNIVVTRTAGLAPNGQPYMVMNLEGPTLEELFEEVRGDFALIAAIAEGILGALGALARRGWAHCDINRGNIFLGRDGEVKLGDFGRARRIKVPGVPGEGSASEPPEPPDPYDDRWRLGGVLFELATGERAPIRGAVAPVVPDSVPSILRVVIAGLLAPLGGRLTLGEGEALLRHRGADRQAVRARVFELAHLPEREGWEGWATLADAGVACASGDECADPDDDADADADAWPELIELGGDILIAEDAPVGASRVDRARAAALFAYADAVAAVDSERAATPRRRIPRAARVLALVGAGAFAAVVAMRLASGRPDAGTSVPVERAVSAQAPSAERPESPESSEPGHLPEHLIEQTDAAVAAPRDRTAPVPGPDVVDAEITDAPARNEAVRPTEYQIGVRKPSRPADDSEDSEDDDRERTTRPALERSAESGDEEREKRRHDARFLEGQHEFILNGFAQRDGIAMSVERWLWLENGAATIKVVVRNTSGSRFRAGVIRLRDRRGQPVRFAVSRILPAPVDESSPIVGASDEIAIALRVYDAERLAGRSFSLAVGDPDSGRTVTVRDVQWR